MKTLSSLGILFALCTLVSPSGNGPQAAGARCAQEDFVRSAEGAVSSSITFVNATGGRLRTYWIDYDGRRKFYAEILPGGRHFQQTFLTHPWVITNSQEDCLGVYMPAPFPQHFVVG
jgi:hypothetical protein